MPNPPSSTPPSDKRSAIARARAQNLAAQADRTAPPEAPDGEVNPPAETPFDPPYHRTWYVGLLAPPRPEMVAPMAVLMYADAIADKERRVNILDLYKAFPRPTISDFLLRMQNSKWIHSDGATIVIRTTPREEQQ